MNLVVQESFHIFLLLCAFHFYAPCSTCVGDAGKGLL